MRHIMQSRSASSLFPIRTDRDCVPGLVALRRGAWQPSLQPERPPQRPAWASRHPAGVTGWPVRDALRGLLVWFERARALNSRAL